jgi:adenylosuccinate lyase
MTSSDVLDTCLNVQLVRAADILLADIDRCWPPSSAAPTSTRMTVCIGRSHGIHAEPTTFGLKLRAPTPSSTAAGTACENARKEIATCAISGAVGTFANIDPAVEEHVCQGWA